jgi:tetratricopeptide (TPR) repeat protein
MRALWFISILLALLACAHAYAAETGGCSDPDPDIRIAACSAIIAIGPGAAADFSMVLNNRGSGYAAKGKYEQAILDYDEAISINPNFSLAYSNRGVAHEAAGLFQRAIADYSKAIALDPSFRAAFNNRCYALAESGHAAEAMPDCDKAVMLQSRDARAWDSRGFVYFLLGRYSEAIHDLDEALTLDSNMPTALYIRGLAKLRAGDSAGKNDLEHAGRLDKKISDMMARISISAHAEALIPQMPVH